MQQENTSLDLYQQQKKAELVEKVVKLINDDNFDINSLSSEEARDAKEIVKKLFSEVLEK